MIMIMIVIVLFSLWIEYCLPYLEYSFDVGLTIFEQIARDGEYYTVRVGPV
jgi:hypothetical protein